LWELGQTYKLEGLLMAGDDDLVKSFSINVLSYEIGGNLVGAVSATRSMQIYESKGRYDSSFR
jgi:hypothetical protein